MKSVFQPYSSIGAGIGDTVILVRPLILPPLPHIVLLTIISAATICQFGIANIGANKFSGKAAVRILPR